MEQKLVQAMNMIFKWLKTSIICFVVLCMGGIIGGIIAALSTSNMLSNDEDISFKEAIQIGKDSVMESWKNSICYASVSFIILRLIYITSQFQGYLFFISFIVQLFILLLIQLMIFGEAQLRLYIEANNINMSKLSFIQVFMFPKITLYTIFYLFLCIMILKLFPAIIFFFSVPVWSAIFRPLYYKEFHNKGLI